MPAHSDNEATQILDAIREWFDSKEFQDIRMETNRKDPPGDQDEDYIVIYEILFKPSSKQQAQIEVWITDDSKIGIGIETWPRVLEKFGEQSSSTRFAGGHEPDKINLGAFLALMEVIAKGGLAVERRGISLFNLYSFKFYISKSNFQVLNEKGYGPVNFVTPADELPEGKNVFHFKAWK